MENDCPTDDREAIQREFPHLTIYIRATCRSTVTTVAETAHKIPAAISVQRRAAIAMYLLSTTCELRTAAHLFGIGKSTAASILHEFYHALVN